MGSRRRTLHWPSYLLAVACVWLWVGRAGAATVAVLAPQSDTPAFREAVYRLQGELFAVGLSVLMIERPPVTPTESEAAREWLQRTSLAGRIDAFIDVLGESAPTAVDVWLCERSPRRLRLSRVPLDRDAEDAAATLAIRAIDVLRSSFLARDFAVPRAAPVREPAPAEESGPRRDAPAKLAAESLPRLGLEAGATVLTSFDGLGAALLPLARIDWAFRTWLALQVTAAGFGTRPELVAAAGSVEVTQQFGLVGLCVCELGRTGIRPFAAVSAGVMHTGLDGQANAPNLGHHLDQWALLLDGNAGARLSLSGRLYLTLAAHVQLAEPYVAIHLADTLLATAGRPNLLVTFTAGARL